jgi:hypothetical protein
MGTTHGKISYGWKEGHWKRARRRSFEMTEINGEITQSGNI